jgi:hypothetical protein
VVQVPGRSALFDVNDLGNCEAAVGVLGGNLEVDHPGSEHLALASKPIRPGRDEPSRKLALTFSCHERSYPDADLADP